MIPIVGGPLDGMERGIKGSPEVEVLFYPLLILVLHPCRK